MKTVRFLITSGILSLIAAVSACGQTDEMYVNVDAGVSLQQDVKAKDGSAVKFDPGFRGDVAVGYNFYQSFYAELETGAAMNSINSMGGNKLSGFGATADIIEVPILANVIYRVPLKGSFVPFVGLGAGGAATFLDASKVPLLTSGGNADYSDVDLTFAWQAKAGLKYVIGKNMALGVTYKFTGTTKHSWTDNNVVLDTDGTMTHSVVAAFTWSF